MSGEHTTRNLKIGVLIMALSFAILSILFMTNSTEKEYPIIDNSFFEQQIQDLNRENSQLKKIIETRDIKIRKRSIEIDSLRNQKPLIITEYVKIYETIDNAYVIELVEMSDSIFTAENIGY